MTTSSDPDEIRAEIERTRVRLSDDVDALADTANPKHIARRQAGKLKDAAVSAKEHIMGAVEERTDQASGALGDAASAVQDKAQNAAHAVSDKAQNAAHAVGDVPARTKAKARGNPLAAGLIAFGAGMLISGLIPSSAKEQRAVSQLQEKIEPLKQQASEAVKEVAEHLKEPAQDAARAVQQTAVEGAEAVKAEGQQAKSDVQEQVGQSADAVRQSR